ncbi:hypothetical protein M514_08173 [Trichuris suis]|uniref:Uncharacterized protein n=1 Tax=Trichuris suis TaxID=68888 RepID=A0A085NR24_9BILA|nr:hypothetical protein M513_08173 [Trichuris suis]KFD71920.1 hypothetical protein M514_08173 [Trichuris suis]
MGQAVLAERQKWRLVEMRFAMYSTHLSLAESGLLFGQRGPASKEPLTVPEVARRKQPCGSTCWSSRSPFLAKASVAHTHLDP